MGEENEEEKMDWRVRKIAPKKLPIEIIKTSISWISFEVRWIWWWGKLWKWSSKHKIKIWFHKILPIFVKAENSEVISNWK